MVILKGVKVPGGGGASQTLVSQLPLIGEEFPEILGCRAGTINLKLDEALIVLHPDHRTRPIRWYEDAGPDDAGEVFDLIRAHLEVNGAAPVTAWLYVAYGSWHRMDAHSHEILTADLGTIEAGTPCRLIIDRPNLVPAYSLGSNVVVI